MIEDGASPRQVAADSEFCLNYLYPWVTKFKQGGCEALGESITAGPTPKLNERQRQQVRRWIVGEDPGQYGFEFGLWTRRIVAELIAHRFGGALELTAVGRLLAQLQITPQKPSRRAYERDPEAVERWRQHTYPRLRRRLRKQGARISVLDETDLWLERGRRRWCIRLGNGRGSMQSARSMPGASFGVKNPRSDRTWRQNESLRERVVQDLAAVKKHKNLLRSFIMAGSVVSAKD